MLEVKKKVIIETGKTVKHKVVLKPISIFVKVKWRRIDVKL